MSGETLEYKVIVDAVLASEEIKKLTTKMSELENQADTSGKQIGKWQDKIKDLQQKLGPSAAAISSVSSALGASGGAAGQAVNAAGQLAAAFAAGGPLGLALASTTIAVDMLGKQWDEYQKAQEEIRQNEGLWRDALEGVDKVLREGVNKRTRDLTQALKDAQTELRNFGKTSRQLTEEEGRAAIALTEKQLETLDRNLPSLKKKADEARFLISHVGGWGSSGDFFGTEGKEKAKENALVQAQIVDDATERRKNLTEQLVKQKQALTDLVEVNKKNAANEAAAASKPDWRFGERDKYSSAALQERIKRGMAAQQAEDDARAKAAEDAMREVVDNEQKFADQELKRQNDLERQRTEIAKKNAEERKRIAEEEAKAKAEAEKQFQQTVANESMKGVGILLSASESYIKMRIEGEKHAEEAFAASVMAQAGQALVGYGTQLGGKAIMDAFIAPPLAAAEGAAAIGLISAGVALGAGGTAIQHSVAGANATDKTASRDRGAAPRSSGGSSGSGGPLVINVSYGVGGPLPEDTAREIARVMRTGDRRRGA